MAQTAAAEAAAVTTAATMKSITQFLTSSGKVAQALDWKKTTGSVLNLRVCNEKLELAVASHPSFGEPIQKLPSVPLKLETLNKRKFLSHKAIEEMADIVSDYHVCGLVVNWPVQHQGWCGKSCGWCLHVLDQLAQHASIVSYSRPICLWDGKHRLLREDQWGRAPVYSTRTPKNKELHLASKEQYNTAGCLTTELWEDFVMTHWPYLYIMKADYHPSPGRQEQGANLKAAWMDGKTEDPDQQASLLI